MDKLERMVLHLGEPIADPAALNTLFICEAANEKGIKVMLSGTGGDDVFTGYRRHIIPRYSQFIKSYIKPCEGIFRSSLNMFDRTLFCLNDVWIKQIKNITNKSGNKSEKKN